MTANRAAPTIANTPGGINGEGYTDRIAEEITALYKGRVNQVTSVAGSANAITGVCTPPLTAAPAHGETFRLTPGANNTAAVTVNLDATGAIDLLDENGDALTADDIVSGRPVTFWYDDDIDKFRLGAPSLQAILAAVASSIDTSGVWELIGETDIGVVGAAASVEHLFAADDYAQIKVLALGVQPSTGSNNIVFDLRYASGSVLASGSIGGGTIGAAAFYTFECLFTIDPYTSGARRHFLVVQGAGTSVNVTPTFVTVASSVNVPDRVRVNFTSGNINAGLILVFGLKKP